ERFEHTHDNLRVAMDRAAARDDAVIAIGIAFHTWRFWQKRGHLYEARRRLAAVAAADSSRRDPAPVRGLRPTGPAAPRASVPASSRHSAVSAGGRATSSRCATPTAR